MTLVTLFALGGSSPILLYYSYTHNLTILNIKSMCFRSQDKTDISTRCESDNEQVLAVIIGTSHCVITVATHGEPCVFCVTEGANIGGIHQPHTSQPQLSHRVQSPSASYSTIPSSVMNMSCLSLCCYYNLTIGIGSMSSRNDQKLDIFYNSLVTGLQRNFDLSVGFVLEFVDGPLGYTMKHILCVSNSLCLLLSIELPNVGAPNHRL